MTQIKSLFATRLYHAKLSAHGKPVDAGELEQSCLVIADDDEAGVGVRLRDDGRGADPCGSGLIP